MKKLIVHGCVQGVGFRYFVSRFCRKMNIRGWVSNMPNGSVEIVINPENIQILEFIDYLTKNSPGRIDKIDVTDIPERNCGSFEIKF
ncbi:acylphosphatase [candidate division WOR-3 bacterium]|nr:acylphosphatase [candidate division WOR-3 bacterium]